MGQSYSSSQERKLPSIVMRGMESSGKTTLFCHLTQGKYTDAPLLDRWQQTIQCHGHSFALTDMANTYHVFPIQTEVYRKAAAAIYVVDASNRVLMPNVRENLEEILRDDTYESEPKTLLILANKQDIPGGMSITELIEKIGIEKVAWRKSLETETWHVQPCCGLTGDGLKEGLRWLVDKYEEKKRTKKKNSWFSK